MKKITIDWAPNAEKKDILLAASLILQPWRWYRDKDVKKLENKLSDYLSQEVVAFDSARSSLYEILNSLGIQKGDEILLQAYTCVALPNPILWSGGIPVYVDADEENYNIDHEDLEKKITKNSKVVIVQYTYGITPDIEKIIEICNRHNLFLIEDCCHNLGHDLNIGGKKKKAGTIGDAAILSFGQEKVISGTRGGVATFSPNSRLLFEKMGENYYEYLLFRLRKRKQKIRRPRLRDIFRGILNPIIWKIRENIPFLGEAVYKIFVKLKLQELGLNTCELIGKKPKHLPYSMPNTNAILALSQFKRLEKFNKHRSWVVDKYMDKFPIEIKEALWLRFPLRMKNPSFILEKAKKEGIYFGNWYTEVIHSKNVVLEALGYKKDSCPKAEWLSKNTINLPTHIGIAEKEIIKIMEFLKSIEAKAPPP